MNLLNPTYKNLDIEAVCGLYHGSIFMWSVRLGMTKFLIATMWLPMMQRAQERLIS